MFKLDDTEKKQKIIFKDLIIYMPCTGKTLAYGIPVVQFLQAMQPKVKASQRMSKTAHSTSGLY